MNTASRLLRISGVIVLGLGLIAWTQLVQPITTIHMLLGVVLVLTLWFIAVSALRQGVAPSLAVVAIVWGLVVILFGLVQRSIAPADGHLVVQVLHLLFGLTAIGLGEALGAAMAKRRASQG